jgi:hypothetical protein
MCSIALFIFQELFQEHAVEPVKTKLGVKTYPPQEYDITWEQIWYVSAAAAQNITH